MNLHTKDINQTFFSLLSLIDCVLCSHFGGFIFVFCFFLSTIIIIIIFPSVYIQSISVLNYVIAEVSEEQSLERGRERQGLGFIVYNCHQYQTRVYHSRLSVSFSSANILCQHKRREVFLLLIYPLVEYSLRIEAQLNPLFILSFIQF